MPRNSLELYINSRLSESCVNRVNRDRVIRIRRITADVDNDAQPTILPTLLLNELAIEKVRDFGRKVDAVDEYINVQDFLNRPPLLRLIDVPVDDVFAEIYDMRRKWGKYQDSCSRLQPDLLQQVHSTLATSSEGAHDHRLSAGQGVSQCHFERFDHFFFILIRLQLLQPRAILLSCIC